MANNIGSPISPEEYMKLRCEYERLEKVLGEYERECYRGVLKIAHTSRAKNYVDHRIIKEIVSLRIDYRLGESQQPYWKTIFSTESDSEMMKVLERMEASLPQVIEAFKENINKEDLNNGK